MRKFLPYVTLLFVLSILYGCDKEKIITTTETVHEIEYIEMAPDTVRIADTLYLSDSIVINNTDTLFFNSTDTLFVNSTDTLFFNSTDTLFVNTTDTLYQTQIVVDTVEIFQNFYDTVTVTQTVTVTDTVFQTKFSPDVNQAYSALQFYTDPAVLQFINTEFGFSDGWVFYLSSFQNDIVNVSEGVFDLYGYIDYWTPDWSSYYPLEYYWRVTYTGGDPTYPSNWNLTEPPVPVKGNDGGIKLENERANSDLK